jgi:peptidyl-prolyl cis-trans isomerase A (cyclophilin A)
MKTLKFATLLLSFATLPLIAQSLPDAPSAAKAGPQPTGPTVVLDTTMGRITCKLYSKEAPITSQNFIDLAEGKKPWTDPVSKRHMVGKRYYDGTIFHRVIPQFMAQGGDPSGTGTGDAGYFFKNEPTPTLHFDVAGRLAMANAGPDTNSSQFFITEAPTPFLDGGYNLFGQCDDAGVAVVKAITRTPRDAQDKPLTPVVLKKVTVVREGQPLPPLPGAAPAAAAKPAATTHPKTSTTK